IASRTLASDAEVHGFEADRGAMLIIAWLRWNTPGFLPSDRIDRRHERVHLNLCNHARLLASEDEIGNSTDAATTQLKARDTSVDLNLTGNHLLILQFGRDEMVLD